MKMSVRYSLGIVVLLAAFTVPVLGDGNTETPPLAPPPIATPTPSAPTTNTQDGNTETPPLSALTIETTLGLMQIVLGIF